jgi:hypothetical protein
MSRDRVGWRNVHLYEASTGEALGGFFQQGSLTEANLIWILTNILLIVDRSWTIRHRGSNRKITPSSNPVVPGEYDIYSEGSTFSCVISAIVLQLTYLGTIQTTDELWFARLTTHSVSGRDDAFRNGVRPFEQEI